MVGDKTSLSQLKRLACTGAGVITVIETYYQYHRLSTLLRSAVQMDLAMVHEWMIDVYESTWDLDLDYFNADAFEYYSTCINQLCVSLSQFGYRFIVKKEACIVFFAINLLATIIVLLWYNRPNLFRLGKQIAANNRYVLSRSPPNDISEQWHESGFRMVKEDISGGKWTLSEGNVSVYAARGIRASMEDRFSILIDAPHSSNPTRFYSIFDGHGGTRIAELAEEHLLHSLASRILSEPQFNQQRLHNWTKILIDEVVTLDKKIFYSTDERYKPQTTQSGSTMLVAVILPDGHLLTANLGDSRAVMCSTDGVAVPVTVDHKPNDVRFPIYLGDSRAVMCSTDGVAVPVTVDHKPNDVRFPIYLGDSRAVMCSTDGVAVPVTVDHKPNDPPEHARIKSLGGFIQYFGVWRVQGILATSRALGDFFLKTPKPYVSSVPEILSFDLNQHKASYFLILATDGLWDVLSNQEAVGMVKSHLDDPSRATDRGTNPLDYAAELLVRSALARGSLDNITVMIVLLPNHHRVAKRPPTISSSVSSSAIVKRSDATAVAGRKYSISGTYVPHAKTDVNMRNSFTLGTTEEYHDYTITDAATTTPEPSTTEATTEYTTTETVLPTTYELTTQETTSESYTTGQSTTDETYTTSVVFTTGDY